MKLFLLTNPEYAGDNNQLQGISMTLAIPAERRSVPESEFRMEQLEEGDIVLLCGDHGLGFIASIKKSQPKAHVIWSGHQWFSDFNHLTVWPDVLAIPKAVYASKANLIPSGVVVVPTDGVAHCINDASILDSMAKFKGLLPSDPSFTTHVGIVIAGDAPTPEKIMKYFDAEDAELQAMHIVRHMKDNGLGHKNTALLIMDGPRTDKHDPEAVCAVGMPYAPDPHRSGHVGASARAFINVLEKEFPGQLFFNNFQFGEESAYKPAMHSVIQTALKKTSGFEGWNAVWYVPTESVTMLAESAFLSGKGIPVIAYCPKSTNESHMEGVSDARQSGQITLWNEPLPAHVKWAGARPAAEAIAEAIQAFISVQEKKTVFSSDAHSLTALGTFAFQSPSAVDSTMTPTQTEQNHPSTKKSGF